MKFWSELTVEQKVERTAKVGAIWFWWCSALTVIAIYATLIR